MSSIIAIRDKNDTARKDAQVISEALAYIESHNVKLTVSEVIRLALKEYRDNLPKKALKIAEQKINEAGAASQR